MSDESKDQNVDSIPDLVRGLLKKKLCNNELIMSAKFIKTKKKVILLRLEFSTELAYNECSFNKQR